TREQAGTSAQSTKLSKPAPKPKLTEQEIAEARQLLNSLGYWIELNATGLDASLRHALIAFQKIAGRPKTGILTTFELEALRAAQPPAPREAGFPHIEVDLARQVLFVVELGDAPLKVLPISSGSGELFTEDDVTRRAITPTGRFKVQRKIEGWRKSPLGLLHYPSYIYGGIAIHGNPSVPATPASHGCIRIPMFASKPFSDLAVIGTVVIVYDDSLAP
ncbi:MAG: murein L,D-transpeptidase, partial [Acidobacteria bacterium]|nr:murein L,D-transpeptidase [Acidobacteriota bacterium]